MQELERIYIYYRDHAEISIAKKLIDGIYTETQKLRKQPKIDQIEELLKHREEQFRF
jgi:plasmid stabilization system protein ParE